MTVPALALNAWLRYDVIARHVAHLRPRRVLELGVGQGAVGSRLATVADYTGVEPDPTSRAIAASRLPPGTRLLEDPAQVEDAAFDLVCAFEVLEHIDDDAAALREWNRKVRPGGHLLISVPAFASRYGAWDERVGHHRRYDPPDLVARLRDGGFEDIDVRAVGFPLGYALEAARNLLARRDRRADQSMDDRTASSGRTYQPSRAGWLTRLATSPFRLVQRAVPGRGTGLVALARRPAA